MKWTISLILILMLGAGYLLYTNKQLREKYNTSVENVKAYDAQLGGLKDDNRVFKLTVEQLNYFNDSIVKKLNESRKELGIKDKHIQQLQYELLTASKADTLDLKDTIFVNNFKLDTIVGDKWVKTHLHMKYPSTIALKPEVTLERHTFINGKRETVNPPKKFFLFRWFQRKHTVVEVTTRELNPYVEEKIQKYIQIID
jgi:hypothetical protein|nr:MAG TPA: hypothetical protein [Caudoviricetes sp.]